MNNSIPKRVVVTGIGWATPLGCDIESVWQDILLGKSGIKNIQDLENEDLRTKVYGYVQGFKPESYLSAKECRKMDKFIQYALAATVDAIEHSKLPLADVADRTGVAFGSGIGGLSTIESNCRIIYENGVKKVSPFFIPASITNMAAGNISIKFGLQGPNLSITTACTTGTHNIGLAARLISSGDATAMVAGGSEYTSCLLGLSGFSALKALASWQGKPEEASRPWDKQRNGFVMSDGAGSLVLEEYEFAKARGANILAEIVGFGMSADAYHMTSPHKDGTGAILAMSGAIKSAGLQTSDIKVINAHGTSTQVGDLAETSAIKSLFADDAAKLKVSSIKSMLGHTLGAAGAIEAISSILSLRDQIVPPTINCDDPDVGCDLDYVRHGAQKQSMDFVLSNSFGFGGTNGSLIFKAI
ncbi:MAG: beta-ketoacyl-ACP synthase II [Pseudomonadota bacterium]|nr:beta-ketoacyl-ACP synthase II [Pseudomonadota bacterium]